jgi:hypothetical protein
VEGEWGLAGRGVEGDLRLVVEVVLRGRDIHFKFAQRTL